MNFQFDPKPLLSALLIGLAFIAGFFAGMGTFETYADGWGTAIGIAFGVLCFIASGLVKKLPI